jgi:hypothetical protein
MAPGNVTVETQWPDKLDADVDLWVEAPGDVPVGYSNKGGRVFDLLRDDLGMAQDMTDSNHEVAYSRGAPAGEYTVNVHIYRGVNATYPVPVKVTVSVKPDSTKSSATAGDNDGPIAQAQPGAYRLEIPAGFDWPTGAR